MKIENSTDRLILADDLLVERLADGRFEFDVRYGESPVLGPEDVKKLILFLGTPSSGDARPSNK